jgi:hypothetical protein
MTRKQVIPAHYPELRLLCWHSDPAKPVTEEQAFGLYERNWRYIDHAHLNENEKALIKLLKDKFGNGVING